MLNDLGLFLFLWAEPLLGLWPIAFALVSTMCGVRIKIKDVVGCLGGDMEVIGLETHFSQSFLHFLGDQQWPLTFCRDLTTELTCIAVCCFQPGLKQNLWLHCHCPIDDCSFIREKSSLEHPNWTPLRVFFLLLNTEQPIKQVLVLSFHGP